MEEESCRKHPGDTQETSRRHPGDPRGTQEAPRRHPGAPRRHPEAPRGTQEPRDILEPECVKTIVFFSVKVVRATTFACTGAT